MKLTNYTNYAFRTLQLAALKSPDLVKVEDVVSIHKVSRPHIVKIVHELGKAGYIETVRGRNGGFKLARPASQIIVGDVVRLTEGSLDIVECFSKETNTCPLRGICNLSKGLMKAANAFMAVLDDMTIEDISANRSDLLTRIRAVDESFIPKQ